MKSSSLTFPSTQHKSKNAYKISWFLILVLFLQLQNMDIVLNSLSDPFYPREIYVPHL